MYPKMENKKYISVNGTILTIDDAAAEGSTLLAPILEEYSNVGTFGNPIPLSLNIPHEEVSTLAKYIKDPSYRGSSNENALYAIALAKLHNYIGYQNGIDILKEQVLIHLRMGDFENYGQLFDILTSVAYVFDLDERDVNAALLNPIHFFSDAAGMIEYKLDESISDSEGYRSTPHDKKKCLIDNYLTDHYSASNMENIFLQSKDYDSFISLINSGKTSLDERPFIPSFIVSIETQPPYTFTLLNYGGPYKMIFIQYGGAYIPTKSLSGTDLNIADHQVGDILHFVYGAKIGNVAMVINMSIYDMPDRIRAPGIILQPMTDVIPTDPVTRENLPIASIKYY